MSQTFVSTTVANMKTDNVNQMTDLNTLRSNFSGSSFPSDAVVGQKCYREDLDKEYVYTSALVWVESSSQSTVEKDVKLAHGELASLTDRLAVSLNEDGSLKTNVTANIAEFIISPLVPTFVSASSFTVPDDQTLVFTVNRQIRLTVDSTYVYSYVSAVSYESTTGVTTVVLNDSIVSSGLTKVSYCVLQKTDARNIVSKPSGNLVSTNVQETLDELAAEKLASTGGTLTGVLNEALGAPIASAATLNLTAATGNTIHITGTTAITAVTLGAGMRRQVIFDGILTLTHSATANNLPGAANITTAAGDRATYISDGTTVYCVHYQRSNGEAIVAAGGGGLRGYNNLKITVTGNAAATITADMLCLLNSVGAAKFLSSVSLTLSAGTNGANGLDTGSLAASSWYYVHAIYNPTTATTACLLSLSATAPTLPVGGYTYSARLGALRSDSSGYLMRTQQLGNAAGYVVTPSTNTSALPTLASGSASHVAVNVRGCIPPTAYVMHFQMYANQGTSSMAVAPNTNYTDPQKIFFMINNGFGACGTRQVTMLLESDNIYFDSSATAGALYCEGWEDNL